MTKLVGRGIPSGAEARVIFFSYGRVDGRVPRPTHRDGAAMNGAQPSIFANKRRRQKQWVGYLPATLWLGDFIHLQCNSGLREQPAVDGCVSLYGDQCLAQDDALEV